MLETAFRSLNPLHTLASLGAGVLLSLLVGVLYFRGVRAQFRLELEKIQNDARFEIARVQGDLEDAHKHLGLVQASHQEAQERLRVSEQDARSLQAELSAANATLAGFRELQGRFDQVNEEVKQLRERNAQFETRLEEHQRQRKHEQELLADAKKALTQEFEQAAHRIFEAKQQQFTSSSKVNLEQVLSPFKQQLGDFHKRVEDIYHKENTQRNQLVGQIAELQKQAQQMSTDAVNLAKALKGDNKAQGNWGEIILERLLEQSGLEKGREYETQVSLQLSLIHI